jgi:membrane-associated phospholipid phosphatase
VRPPEWVSAVYFAYLLVAAGSMGSVPIRRRVRIVAASAASLAGVGMLASLPCLATAQVVRDWAPGVFLLAGYWVPGLFSVAPNARLERWLSRIDARLFALEPVAAVGARAPRLILEVLELSYLSCYALVPGIFAMLYWHPSADAALGTPLWHPSAGAALGTPLWHPSAGAALENRFWTGVLLSEFMCYGLLPWLPSRPPRTLEGASAIDRRGLFTRRLNLWVLGHVSVQANTFPSGHVAGSLIAALIAWQALPIVGAAALFLALLISVATVVGRYHYAADAVLGGLVALAVFALVLMF